MSAHQSTDVSDDALTGLLARLGQAETPRTLPRDRTAALEALLREINETVLPRHLTLKAGDAQIGALALSNRRLVAAGLGDDTPGETEIGALAEVLRLICESEDAVTLTNTGRPAVADDPEGGAPVQALRVALTGLHDLSGAQVLAQIVSDEAVAQADWAGGEEETALSGDETWHPQLSAFVTALRSDTTDGPDGGLLVPLEGHISLIACGDEKNGYAALLSAADALSALARWQGIMGARSD